MAGFTINSVAISGNLTRDPELRSLPSGTSICSLRLAFQERYKDQAGEWQDRPNYVNVTIWGGLGEWYANNAAKGDSLAVQGRLRWREWKAQDGTNRQDLEIVADAISPGAPRGGGGGGGRRSQQEQDFAARDDGFEPRSDVPSGGFEPQPAGAAPPDDDIPF